MNPIQPQTPFDHAYESDKPMTARQRVDALNPISFKEELEKAMDDHAKEKCQALSVMYLELKWCADEMEKALSRAIDGHPHKGCNAVFEMEKARDMYLKLKSLKP